MARIFRIVCFVLLTGVFSRAADGPRRILIFHTFGREFSPYTYVSASFRTKLSSISPEPIEFRDASLEMARFDGIDRDEPLLEFLRSIYSSAPPDLIVPIGAQAAMFCARHREELFSQTPILMLSVDKRRFEGLVDQPNTAVVGLDLNVDGYITNILKVRPKTKHIHLVMGTAPLERFWEKKFLKEWEDFDDRVIFHSLSDQPIPQMCETVKSLPPDSAIIVGFVNRDAAGVPYEFESALRRLHETSNSPIFGILPNQLGLGIVGGPLAPGPYIGESGAEAALEILSGTPAGSLPQVILTNRAPAYDWRELARWKIPPSLLPEGSTIRFREPGLWETHRTILIAALVIFLIQAGLIARLVAARRRTRQLDETISLAADAASIGLWQRHPNSEHFAATARWREIFGLPGTGPVTLPEILERLHPDDRKKMETGIAQAVESGESFEFDHRVIHQDGSVRWISSQGRSFDGDREYGTRGASIDITERMKAEEIAIRQRDELAHLSRVSTLGVLSGALAHELNQPLGIILSNAQAAGFMLESDNPDLEELREIIADIVSEDKRAGGVITRLRSLLRRGETDPQTVAVNDTIEEMLDMTHSDLLSRNITLRLKLAKDLPEVLADRIQLQQVILNLIVNACDAMAENTPPEGVLELLTHESKEGVQVSFRDRGVGLPENIERLFEPFHSTKKHGLGMGLAICRTLIEAQHGRLWAEPNPEKGATFHLILPLSHHTS